METCKYKSFPFIEAQKTLTKILKSSNYRQTRSGCTADVRDANMLQLNINLIALQLRILFGILKLFDSSITDIFIEETCVWYTKC